MKTNHIIDKLKELNKISSQLDVSQAQRISMMTAAEDFADEFLSELDKNKAYNVANVSTEALRITNKKKTFPEVLSIYGQEVAETGINAASGKHLGYIPGGGIFTSAVADFLAAVTNPYASVAYASPGAAAIENEVLVWLKKVFAFPGDAVGNLASGGSISTLIAFTAARDKYGIKNEKVTKSVVYLSEQVHHAAQKALRIIGLEDVILRYIPLDERHKVDTAILKQFVQQDRAQGLNPFLLIGTAGTTNTGSIDPLNEMANIAQENKLWFHVDAAYGGFFILTSKKDLFAGIERADSIIVDPHKGLFLPYGLGAVLIKDKNAALHSHHYAASYMQDAEDEDLTGSAANVSPELTKHFRGLRLWLPLQLHGIEPFVACLEEKLLLTTYFRERLVELGFKVGPEPDLSVSYFWYPFEREQNEMNRRLMDEIHKDGDVFMSSSWIDNRFVIRMAILSFRTKVGAIDRAIDMINRCLDRLM